MGKWFWIIIALLNVSACATLDAAYQGTVKLTDPDKMTLQGDVDWLNPQPNIRFADDLSVYLRIRNSSGASFPTAKLKTQVVSSLQEAGYTLVASRKQAQYVVRLNIRAYGENAAAALSSGSGAVLGGLAGYALSTNDRRQGAAAAGGAILGEVTTNVLRKRNKQVRIDLVADLVVSERVKGGVETIRSSRGYTDLQANEQQASAGTNNSGAAHRASTDRQTVAVVEDFLNHENRLVAYAQRIKLTPEEAVDFVLSKMAAAVGGVLP